MRPGNSDDDQKQRDFFAYELRNAGLSFEYMIVVYASENLAHPEGYILVEGLTEDLTFEILEQISKRLATRKINIGCDQGTSSDPCHERCLCIYGAAGL
jgi:hypothetical protein